MTIYVRMRENAVGLRMGEDAAIDGETAKFLKAQGKAWIVGGDAADFAAHDLECDPDAGPSIFYPAGERMGAVVNPAKEG
jgi:hypothetical protein